MALNRRTFSTSLAGFALAGMRPRLLSAHAHETGKSMREKALTLLNLMETEQRKTATFNFDSRNRTAWNFMLGSRRAPGFALEQMSPEQKDAAMDLLAQGTSSLGLEKAVNIMLQQDILRDEWGKGSADRNRERFCVQIYGTPSATEPWSWRWEGHHLSLTFTMKDDQVISTTPSAFSSEPNTVPSGPHKGLVVLKEEETLARALYSDLDGAARRNALVWSRSPGNIQSVRGKENSIWGERAGVPLADLTESQAQMIERLIEVYTTEVLPTNLADMQSARFAKEDKAALRFAWGGENLDGSIYYRITGENLLIEFATLVNQPQHLHAVFHDVKRNFGAG